MERKRGGKGAKNGVSEGGVGVEGGRGVVDLDNQASHPPTARPYSDFLPHPLNSRAKLYLVSCQIFYRNTVNVNSLRNALLIRYNVSFCSFCSIIENKNGIASLLKFLFTY